jgi:uncharacterized YkwD family protein
MRFLSKSLSSVWLVAWLLFMLLIPLGVPVPTGSLFDVPSAGEQQAQDYSRTDTQLFADSQRMTPSAQTEVSQQIPAPVQAGATNQAEVSKQTPAPVQAAPTAQRAGGSSGEEQSMLSLVNQARSKAGSRPLYIDASLAKLARMKAQDMVNKGYFSHTSPTYGSPFDMLKSYGVVYSYAGENLAGAATVKSAHDNLMDSPGHRDNILNQNFTRVGIGMVSSEAYGSIFVQIFAD